MTSLSLAARISLMQFALSSVAFGLLPQAATPSPRASASDIRTIIVKNLHFDIHCWCRAVTAATVTSVFTEVSEADIPVLIDLMGDQKEVVGIAASHVLAKFGDRALPSLRNAERSPDSRVRSNAGHTIVLIESARPRR